MHYAAVRQLPQTRHPFVQRVIDLEIFAPEVRTPLPR